jgi:type IX secretion system PorP/SprF family membrane protein
MIKRAHILMLVCVMSLISSGQDIHLTQIYAMPTYLNPAFAGANVCARFTLSYRDQWKGFDGGYKTRMAGFDHSIGTSMWGIGALVAQDEAGLGGLKTTLVQPALSYEVKFDRESSLRLAIQPGIGMKSIDYSKLTFGDQIYRGGNVSTVEDIPTSRTYFDFGMGGIYSYKNYWGGAAVFHLNRPNESLYNSFSGRLPVRYSFHGGARFDLSPDERDMFQKKYITAVMHYHGQAKFDQVDLGFYFSKSVFTIGFWYRGIPGLKSYQPGYQNHDALAILLGLQLKKFRIGYSYDNTISYLAGISRGAHEISLSFQLCTTKHKKRRLALISCPKF